ncbi:putative ABC transport system ATP-binding protein [Lipingzhangella halophila]|uniref:Putative ABC transport system ATP-binding protein n=1 Tax=Lipingzhangella halophila TaxID=1783352 RepID=A0A7W7RFZ1_9ACTN|nr:ATP-binding cassette domain-containing protein [Lipingzhangella halophila]MBB4931278.1 putative ABC transport system ATP-binding protein [Lipingzhangella halophila]
MVADHPRLAVLRLDDTVLSAVGGRGLARIRAERLGFVFQNFNLIPRLSAVENVETALAPLGTGGAERRRRAEGALADVGLAERVAHLPSELSGGQQQRVAIARALVKDPEVMDLLEHLWRERGLALVLVTHDSAVADHAERHLHIQRGQVSERSGSRGAAPRAAFPGPPGS